MEIGTAYAVWSGMGTALLAVLGIIFYKEPFTAARVFAIVLIIAGVLMLHLSTTKSFDTN